MDNQTIFYVLGGALAVLAVIVSFAGLRSENFPPSGAVMGGVVAVFALLVAGTAAFGVASARDEQAHREAEEAEHAAEEQRASSGAEGGASEAGGATSVEGGEEISPPGATTLQLAADSAALAFDKPQLTAKPGPVTIELDNPAAIPHNVAIGEGGQILAESQTVSDSKTSVSTDLQPGRYEFLCTVPGHAESGMTGTLAVK